MPPVEPKQTETTAQNTVMPSSPNALAPPSSPPVNKGTETHHISNHRLRSVLLVLLLLVVCSSVAFMIGKHGQKVIYRQPIPPPIALPPQAIVVADCVPGLGKQYVIPKDIPNGPIYDVVNSKVIAVEYNYKSVDLFLNPNKLSDTIIPFMKSYQIDHFTTSIGELKAATLAEAQSVPIHLTMYVVPDKEAKQIKCPNTKS